MFFIFFAERETSQHCQCFRHSWCSGHGDRAVSAVSPMTQPGGTARMSRGPCLGDSGSGRGDPNSGFVAAGYSWLWLVTLRAGSSSTGGLGGFHRVLFPSWWGSSFSSGFLSLHMPWSRHRGGLLSSQHHSKTEKEPDISPGTSNGRGCCREVIPV